MKALVSLILGSRYQRQFQAHCYARWKAYTARHGLDLVLFTEPLDVSNRAQARSAAWQKCLAVTNPTVRKYDQVAWVDSDILINPETAPSLFDSVPLDRIGAVADFVYPFESSFRRRLALLEERWRAQGAEVVSALTPQEYYRAVSLPEGEQVVQTGVLVLSPDLHAPAFLRTYTNYEDRGSAAYHYEMRPLSHEILNSTAVTWLDPRFNMVLSFGLADSEVEGFVAPYGLLDRLGIRLQLPLSSNQRRYRTVYRRLFRESYFLHFAGRQHEMFLV
jgi:hypothetical protein